MYGALNVSTSGLVANRVWAESIAANLAGQNAVFNAEGEYEPYRAKRVLFSQGAEDGGPGVHVAAIEEDPNPYRYIYDPGSPYSDPETGMRAVPNISPEVEQVNMMVATRAYEANIIAAEATKSMLQSSLRLLA